MKKVLSIMLTAIMLLSVFGGAVVFAEDTFFIGNLYFTLDNYNYGSSTDGIKVDCVYDYLFDKYEAYIADEAGLKVTGNIEAETEYYLCIKFTLNEKVDSSSVSKKTVFLSGRMMNDATPYKFRGLNGSYIITFKLPVLAKGFERIDFKIDGYGVGNHTDDIKITTDTKNVEIYKIGWAIRTLDDSVYSAAEGVIKSGVNYILRIYVNVPEGYSPVGLSRECITLTGLPSGELNSGGHTENGNSFNGISTKGDTAFSIPFLIPADGEELIPLEGIEFKVIGNNERSKVNDLKVEVADKEIEIRNRTVYEYNESTLTGVRAILLNNEVFIPTVKYFMTVDVKIPDAYYINTEDVDLKDFTLFGVAAKKCERGVGIRAEDGYNVYKFTFDIPIFEEGEVYVEENEELAASGDYDGDGEITVHDALDILRVIVGFVEADDDILKNCDVDGDREITVIDAYHVLCLAVGLK